TWTVRTQLTDPSLQRIGRRWLEYNLCQTDIFVVILLAVLRIVVFRRAEKKEWQSGTIWIRIDLMNQTPFFRIRMCQIPRNCAGSALRERGVQILVRGDGHRNQFL